MNRTAPAEKSFIRSSRFRRTSGAALLIVCSFLIGYFVRPVWPALAGGSSGYFPGLAGTTTAALRRTDPSYKLIKPLLLCSEKTADYEYASLKNMLASYVNGKIKNKSAQDVSVYYKDMTTGQWAGVNVDDPYSPASLMKVPVMMAYYKLAENDPSILSNQVLYDAKDDLNAGEHYSPNGTLQAGKTYTFENLVETMIEKSDNNALGVLQHYLDPRVLGEIYADLGLPLPPSGDNGATEDYLSARSYSHFFRILYNATYLDPEYSEKALEVLAHTDFNLGLEAGVPAGTTVAEKFGERSVYDDNNVLISRELHDCGIIYGPGDPYVLCVMTKGSDFDTLSSIIKDISAMTYSHVTGK